jgi:Ca2+-binding EF-hand superfamily protein
MTQGSGKQHLTIKEFYEMYDKVMPKLCDREVALEVFQELDADRDGKLTFKDFHDAMLFEL